MPIQLNTGQIFEKFRQNLVTIANAQARLRERCLGGANGRGAQRPAHGERGASAGPPPWLKGSIGEGSKLSNFSHQSSVKILGIERKPKFLESKENHEKHRREKNHFNEAAFDPKYKKGPHEWKEKGNKLH